MTHSKRASTRAPTVFCAPSTGRESFGLILLEALATGVPTIASDIPGYAAVIRQGVDGLLVEPKNADALALGIVRLLADTELRQRVRLNALARAEQFTLAGGRPASAGRSSNARWPPNRNSARIAVAAPSWRAGG